MLLTVLIVNSLYFAASLQYGISNLHQSTKYQTPQETPSPDLNERFNIPTIIRAIPKPKSIQGTVRLINKGEKITNKRNAYLQPNFNPSDNTKRTVRDEYSSPILNITKEHPTKQVPNILGVFKPSVARPKNGYSVLSMSSGLHHGTKLQPIASNPQTNLPKQKNSGILQVNQILNPKCNNFREQFIQCGCERTCTNTQGECIYKPCDTGCYCRNGWVRDASQNCVLSSYYCKNPLNNSGFRKNSFVIHEVSTQERRPLQFIQLHQSSRLIPVQFNKPPISLVCTIPHQTAYIPQIIIYSEQDYHKLKRAAYSPNIFQILDPSNWSESQKKQNIFQLFHEREVNVPICNENEDAVRCACEKTCDDPKGKRCQSSCENGCVCKDGFIRIDKNCYHVSACDLISKTQSQKIISPTDIPNPFNSERYLKSASENTSSFPLTFKNFQSLADSKSPFPLPQKLDSDEQADYGITHFTNSWLDALNISTSGRVNGESRMTTSSFTSEQECRENEEYLQCGCERTCTSPDPKCLECKPGCFCKMGFVKDDFSQCILLNFCPRKI